MRPNIHKLSCLIRRHAERCDDETGDAELLARFAETRDEVAFEQLLRRYGSMVYAVCRRALHTSADAEDAFQATFLSLVRKSRTVKRGGALGGWLHSTAIRSAAQIVRRNRRREARELVLARSEFSEAIPSDDELGRILDEELADLPARYRDPIVLCRVRGVTLAAAAEDLGLSVAGVWKRVQRGEDLLRERLSRRGVTAPAAGLAAVWMSNAILSANEPQLHELLRAALARETAKAAVPAAWWCVGGATALGVALAVVVSLRDGPANPPPTVSAVPAMPVAMPLEIPAKDGAPRAWTVIRGVVIDVDGRALPNAKLGLRAHGTAIVMTEKSDENGGYRFVVPNLFWNEADSVSLTVIEPACPHVRVPILPPFEETRRVIPVRLTPPPAANAAAALPIRVVAGQVTAADTGKPVANALVELGSDAVPGGKVSMRTTAEGRYSLAAPDRPVLWVRVVPPEGSAHLSMSKSVRANAGMGPAVADVALPVGQALEGAVVDHEGRPVGGARVRYLSGGVWNPSAPQATEATTDADGKYAIAVPNRNGTIAVTASDNFRLLVRDATMAQPIPGEASALLGIAGKSGTKLPAIRLEPGAVIRGSVRFADGTPLATGSVWCDERFGTMEPRSQRAIPVVDGQFAIRGCDPRRTYSVVVTDRDSRYIAAATLKATDEETVLTLTPVEPRPE